MFLYEQRAGECGKEELLVHKKTPPAEPGLGRGSHLQDWLGVRKKRAKKWTDSKKSQTWTRKTHLQSALEISL